MNAHALGRHPPPVRWLKRLFAGDAPPSPVLLRVAASGGSSVVSVHATWSPSGRRTSRSLRTAAGLCVMPWLGDEEGVELAIRTDRGAAALTLRRDRPDGGRVHELSVS